MLYPQISTEPAVFSTSPQSTQMVVDFPAPLGPRSAKKSPCSTDKEIHFRATTQLEYVLVRFWMVNAVFLFIEMEKNMY